MRLYVAGKWSDKEAIRAFMTRLREAGHVITEDWTQHAGNEPGKPKEPSLLRDDAEKDLAGIYSADAIIAVMSDPQYAYRGTFFELGLALGFSKHVIIIANPDPDATFRRVAFFHLGKFVILNSEEDVLKLLVR